MQTNSIHVSQVKGRIHAAIITIRHDEYDAVESRLGDSIPIDGGNNNYELATLEGNGNGPILVALTRCVTQGNISAQAVTNNIISDLDPGWLLLVGIAGALPDDEYSLGDVIVASALHDFSFGGANPDGTRAYETAGGPMHPDVGRFLQTKIGGGNRNRLVELAGFKNNMNFTQHPEVPSTKNALGRKVYGEPEWRKKVKEKVMQRFPEGTRKDGPRLLSGPCANGNLVVKDPALIKEWQKSARQVVNVETELAGVYAAAQTAGRQNYPVLAIRGLSDVVGLRREGAWTQYACDVAAAIACAVLQSGFIDFSKNLPPDGNKGITPPPSNLRQTNMTGSKYKAEHDITHVEEFQSPHHNVILVSTLYNNNYYYADTSYKDATIIRTDCRREPREVIEFSGTLSSEGDTTKTESELSARIKNEFDVLVGKFLIYLIGIQQKVSQGELDVRTALDSMVTRLAAIMVSLKGQKQ